MKKLWIAVCALGLALIAISFVVTVMHFYNIAPHIIGGADWPTLAWAFEAHGRWLAEIGWAAFVVSVAGLLYKK